MKIGLYHYARFMTSKSTPVVVTIAPGQITVAASDHLVLNAWASDLTLKRGKASGSVSVIHPGGKFVLAALGSNSGAPFAPEQIAEIEAAQQVAVNDPHASQFQLSQFVWIGQPSRSDGTYYGGLTSLFTGEAIDQKRVGEIALEAMIGAGARRA